MPSSLSLSGHEVDIYLCYALKHLRGGPVELALHGVQRNDIIAARGTTSDGRIFYQTILSFATIFFGMQKRQASITNEGYAVLGTSLNRLNQALSNPRTYVSDDVLLSVITLALLESFVPSSPQQYLNHMLALEKLIELRGPVSLSSELLRGVRYMILFASLRSGRPSILAQAEWKRVLRESCADAEMQEQDLFDVLADCTVLLAECDDASSISVADDGLGTRLQRIQQSTLTLLFYLHAWRLRWSRDERNIYTEVSSDSPGQSPHNHSSTDIVFEFSNLPAAMMMMLYNTTLIYVLRVLESLSCEAPNIHLMQSLTSSSWAGHGDSETTVANIEETWVSTQILAALDICRCIPYLAKQPSVDLRVVNLAITTVWMTVGTQDSAACVWIKEMLSSTGQELIVRGLRPDSNNSTRSDQFGQHQRVSEIQSPPVVLASR